MDTKGALPPLAALAAIHPWDISGQMNGIGADCEVFFGRTVLRLLDVDGRRKVVIGIKRLQGVG